MVPGQHRPKRSLNRKGSRRRDHLPWAIAELEPRLLLAGDVGVATSTAVDFAEVSTQDGPTTHQQVAQQSFATASLVFIDSEVEDASLLAGFAANAEVILLDANQDAITQISQTLATRSDVASIHIVSHGEAGELKLCGQIIDADVLRARGEEIAKWSFSLSSTADILLYGCSVGAGFSGEALMDQIATLTGADVAASIDMTGAREAGGNWELEKAIGRIEASLAFEATVMARYQHTLPTSTQLLDFSSFSSSDDIDTNAGASITGGRLQLTSDAAYQRGSAFYATPVSVTNETAFQTHFSFEISGGVGEAGADGIVFLLQNSGAATGAVGGNGSNLGYAGIKNSIAIEFDTWKNGWDQSDNEIALVLNGVKTDQVAQATSPFDLNSGSTHHAWVDYSGTTETLSVYVSESNQKPTSPVLTTNVSLESIVGDKFYAGFTSSNYNLPNSHQVLSWDMSIEEPDVDPPVGNDRFVIETANVSVGESDGQAVVRIRRTGDLSQAGSVSYQTSNQTALAGNDYVAKSGVAYFGVNQSVAEVSILILDDDSPELLESFTLALSDPVGAELGSPSTATVNVVDDEQQLPSFGTFTTNDAIDLNGGASIGSGKLELTSDAAYQKGSAFFTTPIEMTSSDSFQTSFSFEMTGGAGVNGADGLVFILQNSGAGAAALGGGGSGMGYAGIGKSIAIEFDTWKNGWDQYLDGISVTTNGIKQVQIAEVQSPLNLNSGEIIHAWVDYNASNQQLNVYLSSSNLKPAAATLTTTIDLVQILGDKFYAGFTASNYNLPNAHRILSWSMNLETPSGGGDGPGTFGLEMSQVTVSEDSGQAVVRIVRTGDPSGAASINYQTYDQSAIDGSDYTRVAGVADFVDGQTVAEVLIPILDDSLEEGAESFSITIDNPNNAELGVPRTATISILDDEQSLPAFASFGSTALIDLNGGASVTGGGLQVTSDAQYQTGSAFFTSPIDVAADTSFQSSFTFEMTGGSGVDGADGLLFVVQNSIDGSAALGRGGSGMGYDRIGNSVAIELDTWKNGWDKYKDEIGIVADGKIGNQLAQAQSPYNLNNGDTYHVWVDYNGISDVLAVYISDTATKPAYAIAKANVQLDQTVGNQMFAGFTASNYNKPNAHRVLSWWMNLETPPADPPVLPSGDIETVIVANDLIQPTAIDWSADGRNLYISEKAGVVRVVRDGQLVSSPVIDISAIVNNVADRGLLDVAVHPDLDNNPYMYLFYTYDPPEVYDNVGDNYAGPDKKGNRAGRLMRITLDASTNYTTMVQGSELIMLGTNSVWENFNAFTNSVTNIAEPQGGINPDGSYIRDFINSDSTTHSVASLEFAPDGSLFVSIGDGASYNQMDPRAVRVQDIDSLSGKVLRIDPITGQGLSDNPFFNGDADANRSKVYQLGLRNPFRIAVDDVTGRLFIGDVGWTRWEEINTGDPGTNFGWPYYEGGQGYNIVTPGGYIGLPEGQQFLADGGQAEPAIIALSHANDGINAIVMGDVIRGGNLGLLYEGDILFNDLGQGIVRRASVNAEGQVTDVAIFTTGAQYVVDMHQGPDGNMYFVDLLDGQIGRWDVV